MKSYKVFHYFPVDIKNSYTGKNIKGFRFPANGKVYDDSNPADVQNLQEIQLYFGVHEVVQSLEKLMLVGSTKTSKIYRSLLNELINDYKDACIYVLKLASSMCWTRIDPDDASKGYTMSLTPDKALYAIEPAIKGLLLAVQTKMDLQYPDSHILKNVARLEIEKELIDMEENTLGFQKHMKKR